MKSGLLFTSVVSIVLLLIVCTPISNTSGTSDEVLTGSRSAHIFNPDGKTPVAGAMVKIFKSDAVNGELASLQTTDTNGRYSLQDIPAGVYNIWAEKDSLVSFRNDVIIVSDSSDIGPDTLNCPSTLCGIIAVEPQDNPLTVTIQVVGLDKYFNNTDKNGRFAMKGMAEGTYTLLLRSTEPHYTPTAVEVTVGKCSQDTLRDTIRVTYTGIPVVRGLSVSYDTTMGIVHLDWKSAEYRGFQEYLIYRDFFDSAVYSVNPIAAIEDTAFQDTIFKRSITKGPFSGNDTNDYHFRYRVAIRSAVHEIGKTFRVADVMAVSPQKIITKSTISAVHVGKGYVTKNIVDEKLFGSKPITGMASIDDSIHICLHAVNRMRPLVNVTWIDSTGSVIRTTTAAIAGNCLDDTISCIWQTTGMKQLTVVVTDNTGVTTIDTVRIAIIEDQPEIVFFSKDSLNTGGDTIIQKRQYAYGDTLFLHANAKDSFGTIEKIDWIFGSSPGVSASAVVFDTFTVLPDTVCQKFPVIVSVTDDDGNSVSDSLHIKVSLFTPENLHAAFSPRMYQAGLVFKDRMWLYGGVGTTPDIPKTSFKSLDDVWFSSDGRIWNEVKSNIPARSGQAMTVFDNKLWLIGGYASSWGEYRNDIWYSTDGITWNCVTDSAPFAPRIFHSVTAFDHRMWVIGGLTRRGKVRDVWSSADGVSWNMVTDSAPFSSRSCHANVAFDGKLWLIGGEDSEYNPLNDIWYTVDGSEWIMVTGNADFSPRQGHSLLVYNNRIWLLEGYGMNAFDMAEDIWNSKDGIIWNRTGDGESITPRAFHSSMVFHNRIWVIAGMTGYNNCVNDIWRSGNLENK